MVKQMNPELDIYLETDSDNRFEYLYMGFTASKAGWPHCRPVIIVDGSALKVRYGGTLLNACEHDADRSIFPLAFCIAASESNASWEWCFTKLRDSIGIREELAIVADKHKGIKRVVSIVYPETDFDICV